MVEDGILYEAKTTTVPAGTNPATDKLEGPKLVQYVQNHFGQ